MSYLAKILQPEIGSDALKNDIKELLELIGKPIFVLIDDIDRVSKEELFEILRLIRNTGNFPNIKYIVTYDKKYVCEQLSELNIREEYLNKIFMLELTLPKMIDSPQYSFIIDQVEQHINNEDAKSQIKNLIYKDFYVIESSFSDMRQCERFANQLAINVNFITDKNRFKATSFNVGDLFWLELLKFNDRESFLKLQSDPFELLEISYNVHSGVRVYGFPKKYISDKDKPKLTGNTEQILAKLFKDSKYFTGDRNRMAYVENYYKYFSLGLSSYSVNISDFYNIITKSSGLQAVFDKVKNLSDAKKLPSLTDQVLMTRTSKMNLDFARNYVYVIISLKLCNSMNSAIITRKFASDGYDSTH